jgi:hypothetical protein
MLFSLLKIPHLVLRFTSLQAFKLNFEFTKFYGFEADSTARYLVAFLDKHALNGTVSSAVCYY